MQAKPAETTDHSTTIRRGSSASAEEGPVMPDPYVIRDAADVDLGPMRELVRRCIEHMRRAGIDQWDEVYPDGPTIAADVSSRTAIVAADGADVIGMIVLNEHQDPEYADVPWTLPGRAAVIHRLMVDPRWEGRGLARDLMRFAERRAIERGYASIRLDAFCHNPRALRFYLRGGYRLAGRVRFRKGPFDCFEKQLVVPACI
jgi:ribosomal protein S18 acetylase RimI-like enzyme